MSARDQLLRTPSTPEVRHTAEQMSTVPCRPTMLPDPRDVVAELHQPR